MSSDPYAGHMDGITYEQPKVPAKTPTKILIKAGLGLAMIVVGGFLWKWVTTPMLVTVTGTGTVAVPATSASLSITVTSAQSSVAGALSDVQTKVAAVKDVLTKNNVPAEQVSVSQVQVTPAGALVAGASGYQAAIVLSAKTVYVSGLDGLIGQLYGAGATIVGQPVVAVENQGALQASAIAKATQNAADNLGMLPVTKWHLIRKVVSVTQASSGSTSTTTKPGTGSAPDSAAATNGTFEVAQGVSVTYALW